MTNPEINSVSIDGDGNIVISRSDHNTITIYKDQLSPDSYQKLTAIIEGLGKKIDASAAELKEFKEIISRLTKQIEDELKGSEQKESSGSQTGQQAPPLSAAQRSGSMVTLAFLAGLPISVSATYHDHGHAYETGHHLEKGHETSGEAHGIDHQEHPHHDDDPYHHKTHQHEVVHATELLSGDDTLDNFELGDQDLLFDEDNDLTSHQDTYGSDHDDQNLLDQLFLI